MKSYMDDNFLLSNSTAEKLYHEFARDMPLYDYHCHLPVGEILENKKYDNLGEVWLGGDHYKWRAMRANGVAEQFVTGSATWKEKFDKWAETMPMAMRNPLFDWTHLELKRYFGINDILSPDTADSIYERATEMLRSNDFSARKLMTKMNVKLVCTTDDPIDSLEEHKKLKKEGFEVKVLPAFRPDKAMALGTPAAYKAYVEKLSQAAGVEITSFETLVEAVDKRHGYFHEAGCRLSDHGVSYVPDSQATPAELDKIFHMVMEGKTPSANQIDAFQAVFLYEAAKMNHKRGWTQQFHVGVFRNNNSRLFKSLGPDTGFDSVGDYRQGPGLVRLLDRLDSTDQLSKTVLYNVNANDNQLMATLAGCYQDGTVAGKIQWGSGWWFLDQKYGMEEQLNSLSVLGLLSRFVGMLTDSRSFLSYPRHEYFRRILCNLLGRDVEEGAIPGDLDLLGKMVQDISYNNAVDYFKM
jgi:glucuronate isomerase